MRANPVFCAASQLIEHVQVHSCKLITILGSSGLLWQQQKQINIKNVIILLTYDHTKRGWYMSACAFIVHLCTVYLIVE